MRLFTASVLCGLGLFVFAGCGGSDGNLFESASATSGSSSTAGHGGASSSSTMSSSMGGMNEGGMGGTSAGGMGGMTSSSSAMMQSSSTGGPFCGDGTKDPGEDCDGKDFGGKSCKDFNYSKGDGLSCTDKCKLDSSGCMATCDGKLLEPGEICDGNFLGGHDCTEFGYQFPNGLGCDASCQLDPSGCNSFCGNGVAEPGEVCDGFDLAGQDCTQFGYVNPNGLACFFDCLGVDPSGCHPTCNGTLEPGEPCDGQNLAGKDCTAFGFASPAGLACTKCQFDTSGCAAVCGNNAIEPGEQCDDGNMNGGDGCSASCQFEGSTCASAIPVSLALGPPTVLAGSTLLGGSHTGTACAGSAGADRVYLVNVASDGFLTASLTRANTGYDSVLWASSSCNDAAAVKSILCPDSQSNGLGGGEILSFHVSAGSAYYVYVDGSTAANAGNYELVLDLSAGSNCLDPIPITLEAGGPMTFLGTNVNETFSGTGSCGGGSGPDVVYQVTRNGNGPLTFFTDPAGTNYNSVLYSRTTCNDPNSETACSNAASNNGGDTIAFPAVIGGSSFFMWVDGSSSGGLLFQGNYSLVVTP